MIGGTDRVFDAVGDSASLEACVRIIRKKWPQARFENAETGEKYSTLNEIPCGSVRELLVNSDATAEESWDHDRPDSPQNSLISILVRTNEVTIIVDDTESPDMRFILDGIEHLLEYSTHRPIARAA